MSILDRFYKIPFINDMWRGITVAFSASYVPLDLLVAALLFPQRPGPDVECLALRVMPCREFLDTGLHVSTTS